MKASMFKYKTQLYEINHLLETAHIQKAMEDGTYKPEPGLKFGIKERGHARYITSAATADKAVNHITCDEYLTPLLQKYLQYDNSSSQVGKGVAFHRHRFEIQLRKYYEREGTNEGCIGFSDFSGYYDNIVHEIALAQFGQYLAREIKDPEELADVMDKLRLAFRTFELDASRFSDEEIEKMYHEKVRSTLNVGIPASALTGEKMLRKGADIGNQVSQNTGIFLPVPIDNYVKIVCAVKGYGRYSDDFYIIDKSKEHLTLLQKIRDHFGKAVNINSAFRTASHNARQKKASKHSQHLYGKAADIWIAGVSVDALAAYAETLLPGKGGIGRYYTDGFVHVDVREVKSRWVTQ